MPVTLSMKFKDPTIKPLDSMDTWLGDVSSLLLTRNGAISNVVCTIQYIVLSKYGCQSQVLPV